MDEQVRRTVRSLLALAGSDGRVGKRELSYIMKVAEAMGGTRQTVAEEYEACRGSRGLPKLPDDLEERKLVLHLMVKLAVVDGQVDPGERLMLEAFAFRCRVTPEEFEAMLAGALAKKLRGR